MVTTTGSMVAAIPGFTILGGDVFECWKWIEPRDRQTDYVLSAFPPKDCCVQIHEYTSSAEEHPNKHASGEPFSHFSVFFFFHNLNNKRNKTKNIRPLFCYQFNFNGEGVSPGNYYYFVGNSAIERVAGKQKWKAFSTEIQDSRLDRSGRPAISRDP